MLMYIIRHGEPIYDPDSLTPFGHEQAKALVPRLAPVGFEKTFVSPMIRAQQTAKPTCDAIGIQPEICDFLSEGKLYDDLSKMMDTGRRQWCFHQPQFRFKNDETYHMTDDWYNIPAFQGARDIKGGYERFVKGADEFLARLGYVREGDRFRIENPPYERIGVFCHQGVGLTFLAHMLHIPPHIIWGAFDMTHTGITIMEFRDMENGYTIPMCKCLSDTSHIFAAGLPMKYNSGIEI